MLRDYRDPGQLPVCHVSARMSSLRLISKGRRNRLERVTSLEQLARIQRYLSGEYRVRVLGSPDDLSQELQDILAACDAEGFISARYLKDLCGQRSKGERSCDIPSRDVVAQDLQLSSSSSDQFTVEKVSHKKSRKVS